MSNHSTYWNIDSGDGNELSAGIQLESDARKIAQRQANERGESVYLYQVGAGDGQSASESEEIEPQVLATIYERGNGFPEVGDYVPGNDGNLYLIASMGSRIETGAPGVSNHIPNCRLELADWDDCEDGEEHSSEAILDTDD